MLLSRLNNMYVLTLVDSWISIVIILAKIVCRAYMNVCVISCFFLRSYFFFCNLCIRVIFWCETGAVRLKCLRHTDIDDWILEIRCLPDWFIYLSSLWLFFLSYFVPISTTVSWKCVACTWTCGIYATDVPRCSCSWILVIILRYDLRIISQR